MDCVDLTGDTDDEEPQKRTLPQRAGKPRPGDLSIAALESRRVMRPAPLAKRCRPAPKRQRCSPHIKDEGDSHTLVPQRSSEDDHKATDRGSDVDDSEGERQAEQGLQLHGLRPLDDGTFQASSITFKLDPGDAAPVTIGLGQGILVRMTGELGIAKVLAFVQDKNGQVKLALRYGWFASDFVDLALLQHPPVQPRYPRQIYWQKDLCADGQHYVTGKHAGTYKEYIGWGSVAGLCTIKPRAQCTPQELLEPVPEEDHLINGRAEVFFHTSMQYDHTIMRWEHDWAGTEPCGSHDVTVPIQIEGRKLNMMDICCGLGTVSLAGQALTKAVTSTAPTDKRGIQTLWAIERECEDDPITGVRRPAHLQYPFDSFMIGYGCTRITQPVTLQELADAIEAKKQGIAGNPEWGKLPEEGEVDILHASPPCQELSSLNQHTDALKAERVLYPLLDQLMVVIENVQPKFITIEEVDGFLFTHMKVDRKAGEDVKKKVVVRCIWRILLPLLDLGYQVDVRIMNSAHYAVPQLRRRLIVFAAKQGYKLPTPPVPWTHVKLKESRRNGRDEALVKCPDRSWRSIHVQSSPYLDTHRLARPVTAKEALHDLPSPLPPRCEGRGGRKRPRMVSFYPEDNRKLQSPYGAMMREGETKGLVMNHIDMRPATEPFNVQNKIERSSYDAPFPCVFGSNSRHTKAQLHPNPFVHRVLTVAERARLQSIPDHVPLEGPYAAQMQMVGNAVPLLLGWAVLGAVLEAAYGTPAPRPAFLADRPAWDAPDSAAVKALRNAPDAAASEAAVVKALAADTEMELGDDRDAAASETEMDADGDGVSTGDLPEEEADEEDMDSIDVGGQQEEGRGGLQLPNGIKEEPVDLYGSTTRSRFAAIRMKRGTRRSTPDTPDFASTQQGQRAQHSEPFGCLSPTWQQAQQGSKRKPAVKHEETALEQQHGFAGQERLPHGEVRNLEQLGIASGVPRRFAAADDLHCTDGGVAARRCGQQGTSRGASLQPDVAAACCVSAAARQPDQAGARRLERPLFALPEAEQRSLEHSQRPQHDSAAQHDALSGAGDCAWASEHDVITLDSSQPPSAEASKPQTVEDDAIEVDDNSSSGRSNARSSSSAESADDAALSPPTPSPRVSS